MSKAGELYALAERCERAMGPGRDLDELIRCAVFAPAKAFVRQSPINGEWCIYEIRYDGKERSWEPRGLSIEARLGAFTASLDAAMLLVPEGWRVRDFGDWEDRWLVTLMNEDTCETVGSRSGGELPALALCAAALRARADQEAGQ